MACRLAFRGDSLFGTPTVSGHLRTLTVSMGTLTVSMGPRSIWGPGSLYGALAVSMGALAALSVSMGALAALSVSMGALTVSMEP